MLAHWETSIRPLIDAVRPKVVVEVGSEYGHVTRLLLEQTPRETELHSIDPAPAFDCSAMTAEFEGRLVVHQGLSLNVLGSLPPVDLVLIDGDHNWFTVHQELRLIEKTAMTAERHPPVVVLHDVGWPYGRRDMYYDPERIPVGHRLPYAEKGMLPGRGDLVEQGGFNRSLSNGLYEGIERCGVLTAIEDFLEQSSGSWATVFLPGLHGLAVLAYTDLVKGKPALDRVLVQLASPQTLRSLCERVERARIEGLVELSDLQATVCAVTASQKAARSEADHASEQARQASEQARQASEQADHARVQARHAREEADHAREQARHAREETDHAREDAERLRANASHAAERHAQELEAAKSASEALKKKLDAALADQSERDDAVRARDELAKRLRLLAERCDVLEVQARSQPTPNDSITDGAVATEVDDPLTHVRVGSYEVCAHAERALSAVRNVHDSRSWRWGHGTSAVLRRLTLKKPIGTGGVDAAIRELESLLAALKSPPTA